MADLSRWLPFKSRRKSAEEKQSSTRNEQSPGAPQDALSLFSPSVQSLMQRMFDEPFFADPFARVGDLDRWFGDFSPERFNPSIDVVDEEGSVRVTAELPGMAKDDIKVSVDRDLLTIRGEKRNEEESKEKGVFRTERYYGYVQRSVPLPAGLKLDAADAEFKDGVLTVRMPKGKEHHDEATRIEVK